MGEKTSGQVFRETLLERWLARGRPVDSRPWDALPEVDREDLDAAAQVATETFLAAASDDYEFAARLCTAERQRGQLREQLAAADRATADFRRQCSELAGELGAARAGLTELDGERKAWRATAEALRALVAEITGAVEAFAEGVQPITAAQLAEWHERAGDVTSPGVLPPPPAPDSPNPAEDLARYLGELAHRFAAPGALVPSAVARDLAAAAGQLLRTLMRTNSAPGTYTSTPGRAATEILTTWRASTEAVADGTDAAPLPRRVPGATLRDLETRL